jgi:hypothetical protein
MEVGRRKEEEAIKAWVSALHNLYQLKKVLLESSIATAKALSHKLEVDLDLAPTVPEGNPCRNPIVTTSLKKLSKPSSKMA